VSDRNKDLTSVGYISKTGGKENHPSFRGTQFKGKNIGDFYAY